MNKIFMNAALSVQKLFNNYNSNILKYNIAKNFKNNLLAPVFIIGAPRTGSTFLFQLLAKYFHITYVSNLMALFPRYMPIISKLTQSKILSYNELKYSELGYVAGLHAPNEAGAIYRKWFENTNDDYTKKIIKGYIMYISNSLEAPFIAKNMLNSSLERLENIIKIFPNARFIYLKRDLLYNAQSLLLARKSFYGAFDYWWSLKPKGYEEVLKEPPEYQVVWQVAKINNDLESFFAKHEINPVNIEYENLCSEPNKEISRIINELGLSRKEKTKDFQGLIHLNNKRKVDEDVWNKLIKSKNSLIDEKDI